MMQRSKSKTTRSNPSVSSKSSMGIVRPAEIILPPMDNLIIKILGLQLWDEDSRSYHCRVTFFDQLLIDAVIKPTYYNETLILKTLAKGILNFDPSDYEKVCLYADNPLIVQVYPMKDDPTSTTQNGQGSTPLSQSSTASRVPSPLHLPKSSLKTTEEEQHPPEGNTANINILPIFLGEKRLCITKRLEPIQKPKALKMKSWDTLPLITLRLTMARHTKNKEHNDYLKEANPFRITLVGAYNIPFNYEPTYNYISASLLPLYSSENTSLAIYSKGGKLPSGFSSLSFYPKWETLNTADEYYTNGDDKFTCDIKKLTNPENIDVEHYLVYRAQIFSTIWASFHCSLLMGRNKRWFMEHIRKFKWPFEMHCFSEISATYSLSAYIDLFQLLYPGVRSVTAVVPLQWYSHQKMTTNCNCDSLLPNIAKNNMTSRTPQSPASNESTVLQVPTGADEGNAFIIIDVRLARPLFEFVIPPVITEPKIHKMLQQMQDKGRVKRECTGRGQRDDHWRNTVRVAVSSLKSVPHYGMTEFSLFNRQLSETRTHVELSTSFWMEAATYINNNFVIQEFLQPEEKFQELLTLAHVCLVKSAFDTIVSSSNSRSHLPPVLRAARHARQMQDIDHAIELYLLQVTESRTNPRNWRELAVCMLEVDLDQAQTCIDEALKFNYRDPLTLLVKACMVFEEKPDDAEPFFMALLVYFPSWVQVWVIASAYFASRELYIMADKVFECIVQSEENIIPEKFRGFHRGWENELGDWWESVEVLQGTLLYYDAADLLLRIRAVKLAEVCLAQGVIETGECEIYFHLLALSFRLRGKYKDALCHINHAFEKLGEVTSLRTLQGECLHKLNKTVLANEAFQKVESLVGGFTILLSLPTNDTYHIRSVLVDLVRRQPSAYSWMALANNWLQNRENLEDANVTCAVACAVEALKYDRRAGKAWMLLAQYVHPSARREHCRDMAIACGQTLPKPLMEQTNYVTPSRQTLSYRLGWLLPVCKCHMCDHLSVN